MEKQVNAINTFHGEHRFLSNFWIEEDGTHVEGEYQAAKCVDESDRSRIILSPGFYVEPGQAKRIGKTVKLRPDWEQVKLDIMFDLVLNKFADHLKLQAKLIATGKVELIEGNSWHDGFYGICTCGRKSCMTGENHLGKILMEVREMLR